MTFAIKRRQENYAQDVFATWAAEMMATTPVDDWGWELKYLLETWYKRDGVLFTPDTYRRVQRWMADEQEVAWDAERRFGTRDPEAIRRASKNADRHEPPAHLLFDEEAFQFFDPATGRQISEEEILSWGEEEAAAAAEPAPEPVGFDALLDFTPPPGSALDEDFSLEPLFGPPGPPSLLADFEAARQRALELAAE